MMYPIDYYSIDEASEFLSEKLNQPISSKKVVEIAVDGGIRFCKHFDGSLSKFSIVNGALKCEEGEEYGFRGVIGIPSKRIKPPLNELIKPDRDVITFHTIEQIIEITRLHHKSDPRLIEDGVWLGRKKLNHRGEPEQSTFVVHLNEVIIPKKDLLDYIAQNQADRNLPNNESKASASASKAGAMGDAIIECLKSNGYDPLCLPRYINGLPGIKALIRGKLNFDTDAFNRQWQKLLTKKFISYIPK